MKELSNTFMNVSSFKKSIKFHLIFYKISRVLAKKEHVRMIVLTLLGRRGAESARTFSDGNFSMKKGFGGPRFRDFS